MDLIKELAKQISDIEPKPVKDLIKLTLLDYFWLPLWKRSDEGKYLDDYQE